ncbi:Hsp20/alpha crystallin family protein [Clostridium sp. 19966]|uniref:heat shock protein Hsp18 n=1 Tax=Clostridium sp. 19966 TaxID=2768166 RepID=UPI0028DEFD57|nr:heat shock protein Hsp18 [Clostridium sp. 19966]MDT8719278.1 Hsp20/alpha crystallin family protein [Clostridium sp. 19966]
MFDLVPFRRNGLIKKGDDFFNNFLSNLFDEDFESPTSFMGNSFKVDMREDENKYVVEADLPGMNKDAINIEYANNYLVISAKREDSVEDKKDNYIRKERHYGEFKRAFYVDNIDESKIEASFKDGVLRVNLPKVEGYKKNTKRIDIQ